MKLLVRRLAPVLTLAACSASEPADRREAAAGGGEVEVLPLAGAGAAFARFMEEGGFETEAVHDVEREIVFFDVARGAMVSAATGDAVSGWSVNGTDLSWSRSGVDFRVRFGTEQGERRAFFTETASGTICNLELRGPELLGISGTSELPPSP